MTVSDGYLVRDLRQKLEKDPNDLSRFFTVAGIGHRFAG